MIIRHTLSVCALACLCSASTATANWKVTFAENFSGAAVNTSKWNTAYRHGPAPINGELQFYSPDAFTFSNGVISINATKTAAHGQEYTSGVLTTLDKFSQLYGYYEVRAKLPGGSGFWPAFWLLQQNLAWPQEIDIFEFLGHEMEIPKHTLHYMDGEKTAEADYPVLQKDLGDAWHTYGLLWEAGRLVFYIDGVETGRIERPQVPSAPCYILLNNAVGGSWPGAPSSNTVFPNSMQLDYVRVYQKDPAGPYTSIPSHTATIADTANPAEPGAIRFYVGATEVSTTTPAPGGTLAVSTSVKATKNRSSVYVQLHIINASETKIVSKGFASQTFTKEVSKAYSHTFTLPATMPAGEYRVMVEVNDQANGYAWLDGSRDARTLQVGTPATGTVRIYDIVSPYVTQGTAPVVNFKVMANKALSNHHIHMFLYNEEGVQVANTNSQYLSFAANTPVQRTWSLPANLPRGKYRFSAQVFNTNWSANYGWFNCFDAFGVVLNLNNYAISNYATQHVTGSATVLDGGRTLQLSGNTWKKIPLPYTVTANTVLEFDFLTTTGGEVLGIGLDNNNIDTDPHRYFRLTGSQTDVDIDHGANYVTGTWKTFKIPVGEFYTGAMQHLFFVCDNDATNAGNASFRNIVLRDQ